MSKINNSKPNDNMTKFVVLNTASLQLIPTSMIALKHYMVQAVQQVL